MENVSILDQIIDNNKVEAVDNLDAIKIIDDLFGELSDREKDVLVKRHGLYDGEKETLESIGKSHNLTRERIRQIETSSIKKLRELQNLENYLKDLKNIIQELLEEHGGMMEKNFLIDVLAGYSFEGLNIKDKASHRNYINFLITKLLHEEFEDVNNSRHFKGFYKLKFQDIEHLDELAHELVEKVRGHGKIHATDEIINIIKELDKFNDHREKVTGKNSFDIAKILKFDLFEETPDVINNNKILYSLLVALKKIEQNKFGHWGVHNSKEIVPKTINDKIYLVLKHHKEPLHFSKIADYINEIGFDHKIANAATVHNELILDKKYVLVGRGLYGLKEWGFKRGNVIDVIEEILKKAEQPITREEIIDRVLEKRIVKKATIILALMNKDKFGRSDGKYVLRAA